MMEEYRNLAVRLQVVIPASPINVEGARVVQRRATLSGMRYRHPCGSWSHAPNRRIEEV